MKRNDRSFSLIGLCVIINFVNANTMATAGSKVGTLISLTIGLLCLVIATWVAVTEDPEVRK